MDMDSQMITALQQENQRLREQMAVLEAERQEEVMRLNNEITTYRKIFDQVPVGVAVYHLEDLADDYTLRLTAANPANEQLGGPPIEEMVGKTLDENFPGLREQGLPQAFAESIRSGKPFETELIYGDECIIQSAFTLRAVPAPDNCLIALFENITLQKQAEYQLRQMNTELEERVAERTRDLHIFKAVIEAAPDGFAIGGFETGQLIYTNAAFRKMLGYGDDILGLSMIDASTESPEGVGQMLQEVIEQGFWRGETGYRRKDGSTFPATISAIAPRDADGKPLVIAGIIRDITAQKQYEADLQIFKTVIDTAPDGFGIGSIDTGRINYANPAFRAMLGYGDDILEMPMAELYNETPEFLAQVVQETQEQGVWRGEVSYWRKDGSTFPAAVSAVVPRDSYGHPLVAAAIIRDLTRQKQAEAERAALQQQIIDAQRNALRELSTPLIPISDYVVIMPLIGTIDSQRAQQIMEALLDGVARYQANLVILDITGVQMVDTQVAKALVQVAQAVKLLGAQVMLTGIQPQIAQTLVHLGADLSGIQTMGSLQSGIAAAFSYG
jgi:rsbT co-antagonist protein RsbR